MSHMKKSVTLIAAGVLLLASNSLSADTGYYELAKPDKMRTTQKEDVSILDPWDYAIKKGTFKDVAGSLPSHPSWKSCSKWQVVDGWISGPSERLLGLYSTSQIEDQIPLTKQGHPSDDILPALFAAKCVDHIKLPSNMQENQVQIEPLRTNQFIPYVAALRRAKAQTHQNEQSIPIQSIVLPEDGFSSNKSTIIGFTGASAYVSIDALKVCVAVCAPNLGAGAVQLIQGSNWYTFFFSMFAVGMGLGCAALMFFANHRYGISFGPWQKQRNLFSRSSFSDMPHAGWTVVPFSQVELVKEVVDFSSLHISCKNPATFDGLPERWHVPLQSVKLLCKEGRPQELGTGAFGMVYRAIVRKEEAAVKLLKCGKSSEQAQLLHEIKIMERCVSAHVVRFLGYSISNGLLVLLMEFMPGGTLFKALEEREAFQWYNRGRAALFDVAKGLYSIHEQGLIHYDVKSNNILLTEGGHAKIADFGLGRSINDPETMPLAVRGTVPWMAPEVLRPSGGSAGSLASDVWSFSTIIWEVCTLKQPTREISPASILVPKQAPFEVVRLMEACRADDPLQRPSIGEVYDCLEQIKYGPAA